MAMIKQAIKFASSILSLCARVVHWGRRPTDDQIREICSQVLTANDASFELVVRELQMVIRRRLGLPMSYRHPGANREFFAFRYVWRPQQRQPANQPDAGKLPKEQSKEQDKSGIVDNIARNERQKMALLMEHRHILGDISKELMDDNRDLVTKTKKLIAESKKSIAKRKSA